MQSGRVVKCGSHSLLGGCPPVVQPSGRGAGQHKTVWCKSCTSWELSEATDTHTTPIYSTGADGMTSTSFDIPFVACRQGSAWGAPSEKYWEWDDRLKSCSVSSYRLSLSVWIVICIWMRWMCAVIILKRWKHQNVLLRCKYCDFANILPKGQKKWRTMQFRRGWKDTLKYKKYISRAWLLFFLGWLTVACGWFILWPQFQILCSLRDYNICVTTVKMYKDCACIFPSR